MSQRRPALGLLLAVVGILATVDCQASLPGSPQAARSSTPGGSPLLVAADARLYAGDYEGAEAAYNEAAFAYHRTNQRVPGTIE